MLEIFLQSCARVSLNEILSDQEWNLRFTGYAYAFYPNQKMVDLVVVHWASPRISMKTQQVEN